MTTIKYTGDTLEVSNDGRVARIKPEAIYALTRDQDIHEAVAKAIECQGEVVYVPSTSAARGLKPRSAQKYFVQ